MGYGDGAKSLRSQLGDLKECRKLPVGSVTKPFSFSGTGTMKTFRDKMCEVANNYRSFACVLSGARGWMTLRTRSKTCGLEPQKAAPTYMSQRCH